MSNKRSSVLVLAVVVFVVASATASASVAGVDVLLGGSYHNSLESKIGKYIIEKPQWEARSWEGWRYFSLRLRWAGHEIEFIHDKIHLPDTDNIKGFSISDGYNYLVYNLPQVWGPVEVRLGLGVVLGHPEGTIDGYYIGQIGSPTWRVGGLAGQISAAYRGDLVGDLKWIAETKLASGFFHAQYPDPVQSIEVPLSGYHFLFGVGYDW